MKTHWLQMLNGYWDEKYTPYSYNYDFQLDWLYQYFDELMLGEDLESFYLTWKSEQPRLTPKYDIMHSLVTLVKHYFVTMEEGCDLLKITCQWCNSFVDLFQTCVRIFYHIVNEGIIVVCMTHVYLQLMYIAPSFRLLQ